MIDDGSQSIDGFLASLASERVAPAGGSAAAIVGAIGTALCEMVCIHTIDGRDTQEPPALGDTLQQLNRQRTHLLRLAGTDARIVDDLFAGSGERVDQSDEKRSVGVPLAIADVCVTVLELATDVTDSGTHSALVDAGTGTVLVHATLRAAVFTTRSNADRVPDPSFVADVEADISELERRSDRAYEEAMQTIERRT